MSAQAMTRRAPDHRTADVVPIDDRARDGTAQMIERPNTQGRSFELLAWNGREWRYPSGSPFRDVEPTHYRRQRR